MGHTNSADEHKLVSSFEAVRRTLLQEEYADRLDKPLAYWALPRDRRLPLALLGRSVGELLSTPFSEISATRGIGQKKISSLVKLLHRATSDSPPAVPYGIEDLNEGVEPAKQAVSDDATLFDPHIVSEALWVQWCDTVRRFHLGREPLGRIAPSLQSLPTVIWQTPLDEYLCRSLSEIRQLKTHGEKRVRVVLEVYHAVHELLAHAQVDNHLSIRLVPRFVPEVEHFISQAVRRRVPIQRDQLASQLAEPMLRQIEIDSGESVSSLARHRLGVGAEQKSVRDLARELGVTRARVYQLLEDCGKVMHVRWPEGCNQLASLAHLVGAEGQQLFTLTRQLFFGDKDKGVSPSGAERSEGTQR
jgi:hypothetical protein